MENVRSSSVIVSVMRWIARVWSVLILLIALPMVISTDPYLTEPIPLTDWVILGFYLVSYLGLVIAWFWEALGGAVAILGILGHAVAFGLIRGFWFADVIPPIIFGFPAVLFLACWALTRGKQAGAITAS